LCAGFASSIRWRKSVYRWSRRNGEAKRRLEEGVAVAGTVHTLMMAVGEEDRWQVGVAAATTLLKSAERKDERVAGQVYHGARRARSSVYRVVLCRVVPSPPSSSSPGSRLDRLTEAGYWIASENGSQAGAPSAKPWLRCSLIPDLVVVYMPRTCGDEPHKRGSVATASASRGRGGVQALCGIIILRVHHQPPALSSLHRAAVTTAAAVRQRL
jgi:hypothetical protein